MKKKCRCGGIIIDDVCADCEKDYTLPSLNEILSVLRAHRRAGNHAILEAIKDEFCEEERIIEKEVVVYRDFADFFSPIENRPKRGKPTKLTGENLRLARIQIGQGIHFNTVAESLGVHKRTLIEYIHYDGTLTDAGLKRIANERRCVPIKARELLRNERKTHEE